MGTLVDDFESKWIYAGDQYVAVASGRIDGPWNEVMANAYLIAAAPEMLEALRHIADSFWTDGEALVERLEYLQKYARAAIAKAEGREL